MSQMSASAGAPALELPALPPGYRAVSAEVVYADTPLVVAGAEIIAHLKAMARASPRRRARLCAHPSPEAGQQEMLIVMHRDTYVRPHRHFGKTETFTVFEGEADIILFGEDGDVRERFAMGPFGSGERFFYRMPERQYHGLSIRSEWLAFLETTSGPFDPARSEGAPWAPPESDPVAGRKFLAAIVRPKS